METTLHFDTKVSLSQLAQIIREQLPAKDRLALANMLQTEEDDEPTKEQILSRLKEDYIALQNGTLKTRTLKEVLDEL
ncbi:hypothetical protein [Dyadobacter psychrotolerans]|uniref:Uncharacterized protein n=1 Tax=Dyadobacter psychrotolerans TaxID=2541721 RepID=A0A4V2Z3N3_9BACT|nr:hypothetical protein [Dyadobacter psychrotolerans]TDE13338.1 hypothetical protein E0F88_20060 [Dyadobacter psychrotolerans]